MVYHGTRFFTKVVVFGKSSTRIGKMALSCAVAAGILVGVSSKNESSSSTAHVFEILCAKLPELVDDRFRPTLTFLCGKDMIQRPSFNARLYLVQGDVFGFISKEVIDFFVFDTQIATFTAIAALCIGFGILLSRAIMTLYERHLHLLVNEQQTRTKKSRQILCAFLRWRKLLTQILNKTTWEDVLEEVVRSSKTWSWSHELEESVTSKYSWYWS